MCGLFDCQRNALIDANVILVGRAFGVFALDEESTIDTAACFYLVVDKVGIDLFVDSHAIVVLTDNNQALKQDEELGYKILSPKNLCNYIREYNDSLPINERMTLVSRLKELSAR